MVTTSDQTNGRMGQWDKPADSVGWQRHKNTSLPPYLYSTSHGLKLMLIARHLQMQRSYWKINTLP